ncbi:hypothetical protein BH18CHL2_BH18CHL2_11540 [soil metagenome]
MACVLALAFLFTSAVPASADELAADAYVSRLREARALITSALGRPPPLREGLVVSSRELLLRTSAVRLPDGTLVPVSDATLASRLRADDDASLARALVELDALTQAADAAARGFPGDEADERLRQLATEQQARSSGIALAAIGRAIADRLLWWVGRPDPQVAAPALALVALALAGTLITILVRGTRERIRRETIVPELRGERRPDPAAHLRVADEALRAGRWREAIHAYYLYSIATLALRDELAADPALTDRELLTRAAAVPHVEQLRELVGLHEGIWFGLRRPGADDASRARSLAAQVG